MKKYYGLLILLCITVFSICLSSCSKEEDEEATYTLKWQSYASFVDDVYIFEYSESGDKIASNEVGKPSTSQSYKFTANKRAVKVKVYYEFDGTPMWIQQVFYLEKGKNIDIVVNGETMVGRKEP